MVKLKENNTIISRLTSISFVIEDRISPNEVSEDDIKVLGLLYMFCVGQGGFKMNSDGTFEHIAEYQPQIYYKTSIEGSQEKNESTKPV